MAVYHNRLIDGEEGEREREREGGEGEGEREGGVRKGGGRERERSQNSHLFFSFAAFFIRPFYKMMLKKAITLDDMQSVVSWTFNYYHTNNVRPIDILL